jgi:hypothetical protein
MGFQRCPEITCDFKEWNEASRWSRSEPELGVDRPKAIACNPRLSTPHIIIVNDFVNLL